MSIENEIRSPRNKSAINRPKIMEGDLIFDERVHERSIAGKYNSRVNRKLREEEEFATEDDLIIENTISAANTSKRKEMKKKTKNYACDDKREVEKDATQKNNAITKRQ